jgi:hypothetical protein
MRDREAEIQAVATRLDGLLDDLAAAFGALSAILPPGEPEPPGTDERLVGT